jgi:hypothetical protein
MGFFVEQFAEANVIEFGERALAAKRGCRR